MTNVRDIQPTGTTLLLQNVTDREGHAVFTIESYIVLIWKTPPTLAGVDDCHRLFGLMRLLRPKAKLGYLAIVEPSAGRNMPEAVREALTSMLKEFRNNIGASAVVFEGTGFRASIVRCVVAAINLATRIEFPSKVESDLQRAALWLTDRTPARSDVPARQITSAVNQFRRRWNPSVRDSLSPDAASVTARNV